MSTIHVAIAPHPRLDARLLEVELPAPLADLPSPDWLRDLLRLDAAMAFETPSDDLRKTLRDLLRASGFKPTGRSKPSPEYLRRAAIEGTLASINAAVDVGNAVSLHSGLPISVVDRDRLTPPLRIDVAAPGTRYAFNASGQELDLTGLVALADAAGPCANAVKDAQRTKTDATTRALIVVVWGDRSLSSLTEQVSAACAELFERLRGRVTRLPLRSVQGEPRVDVGRL